MRGARLGMAMGAALALACEGGATTPGGVDAGGGGTDAGPAVDAPPPVGDVTYYGDVRPILAEHCVGCHVAGGIGPFPLDTYAVTRGLSQRIMEVTRDRIMPPYLADNSGECQTFRDARWLSDRELEVLAAWHAQGAPEGDPSTPAPIVPELPRLTGAVTTIDTGVDYMADPSVDDDYRCFLADAPFDTNYFLTGYEVHPGNTRTVHHVIVYAPQDAAAGDDARARDAAEAGPGYTCFGAAGVNAFPVVLWAPGGGATLYPSNTGVLLTGGAPLIIQVHYNNLAGRGETDRTRVDLQTTEGGVTRAFFIPVADFDMNIPGRMNRVSTSATFRISDFVSGIAVRVHGVFPHMHTLGRELRVTMEQGGAEQCLVDVPRWDFNWQLAYFYDTPGRLDAEVVARDRVHVVADRHAVQSRRPGDHHLHLRHHGARRSRPVG